MKKCRAILGMLVLLLGISLISPTPTQAAVKLNKKTLTLTEGETATLKLTGTKKTKKITWKSNKKAVATVNQKGKVRAKSAGTAVISAKYGSQTKKCTVTVLTDYAKYYEYQVKYGKIAINKLLRISETELVIPETIEGCPVTELADGLFQNCDGLVSVTLPAGVTRIGADTFSGCRQLREVKSSANLTAIGARAFYDCQSLETLPEGISGITAIAEGTFYNCDALTTVPALTGLTTVGNEAFYDCDGLLTFFGAETLTSIGDRAFYGCDSLLGTSGCKNVTTIGSSCFTDCKAMTNVSLGSRLTTLGADVFSGCERLSGVSLPATLTTIPDRCFYNCYALSSISIPVSVTRIGSMAFFNCISLKTVTVPGTALTAIAADAFAGAPLSDMGIWYHSVAGSFLDGWLATSGIPAANRHPI